MKKINGIIAMALLVAALPLHAAASESKAVATSPTQSRPALPSPRASDDASPSQEMIQEYERRLFPAPACLALGSCSQIQKVTINAKFESINVELEIHAQARSSSRLPSLGGGQWVSGSGSAKFARASDGSIGLLVEPGINKVTLGIAAQGDEVVVGFADAPKSVAKSVTGWSLEMVDKGALTSLKLTRITSASGAKPDHESPAAAAKFDAPLFMDVIRTLSFDASGAQEQISLTRLTPPEKPATANLDVLEGERIITEGIASADGKSAKIEFAAGERSVTIVAKWDYAAKFDLSVPAAGDRRETWVVQPWSKAPLKFEGIVPAASDGDAASLLFLPKPGEKLTMRPQAVVPAKGAQIAIDRSEVIESAGSERIERSWSISARSTIGSTLELSVPKEWVLESATRNGASSPPARKGDKYVLDLIPGQNIFLLMFKQDQEKLWFSGSPRFEIAAPTANLAWVLSVPNDQWVVFAWGPVLGPAVLIWGVFAAMGLLGWVLAKKLRASFAPSFVGWLAILVPLSALSPWSALFLVVFVFALAAKERAQGMIEIKNWNVVQLALLSMGVVSALILLTAVYQGLLGAPDMMVVGNGSNSSRLSWYADKALRSGELFTGFAAGAILAPIWLWRAIMLAWALWIAASVIKRLPAMWAAMSLGGLWRKKPQAPKPAASKDAAADQEEMNNDAPAAKP